MNHPFYRDMAAHPPVMAAIEPLIGPDIRVRAGGKVNLKSAGHGAAVEWHQDWAFYPHTNDDVLAVGILLDEANENNGPMMVLPGSHLGPIHDHHSDGAFCGAIDLARTPLDLSGAVALTAPAGSITIHHARLVHGSATNRSDRPRRRTPGRSRVSSRSTTSRSSTAEWCMERRSWNRASHPSRCGCRFPERPIRARSTRISEHSGTATSRLRTRRAVS